MLDTFHVRVPAAEEGGFWAEVLDLPGCVTQAETQEALMVFIQDAIQVHLAGMRIAGIPMPDIRQVRIAA